MAGNIIPAIATTNAVIAGLIVMQALTLLKKTPSVKTTRPYLQAVPDRPLHTTALFPPNSDCAVCRDVYVATKVDTAKCTLGEFLETAKSWLAPSLGDDEEFEVSVNEGSRLLADPDFDDNHGRTLGDLGIERGKTITLTDEDDKYRPVHFCILLPSSDTADAITLPKERPTLALRPPKPAAKEATPESDDDGIEAVSAPSLPKKRSADDDGEETTAKKRKISTEKSDGGQEAVINVNVFVDDDDDFVIL
jgi:ubiquitin-like 1-activating enzyme E1 B